MSDLQWRWACKACKKRGEFSLREAVLDHQTCDGVVAWLKGGPVETAADYVMTSVVDVLLEQVQGPMDRVAVRHALREDVVLLIAEGFSDGAS